MANETILTIIGNLTADIEVKQTNNGRSVANFSIASTPRQFNRQTQQWEDGQALFMRCGAWGDLAEHCARTLSKGMRVIAQGRLQQRSYQANDGTNRTVVEMQVDEIGPSLRYATAQIQRIQQDNGFQSGGQQGMPAQSGFNGNGFQSAPQGGYPQGTSPQGGYQQPQDVNPRRGQPQQQAPQHGDPWAQSQGFQQFQQTNDFGGGGDEPEF